MAAKIWKYEKDCQRTEALVKQTVDAASRPGWGHCAMKVLCSLRVTRPKATPIALHFIDVSAKEMLSGRHDTAKLCFLVAQSIADKALMTEMAAIFNSVFFTAACNCEKCQRKAAAFLKLNGMVEKLEDKLKNLSGLPPTLMGAIQQAMQGMGNQLSNLPDGLSEVEIMPGFKAHVIKQSFGTPPAPQAKKKKGKGKAVLPEGNRWN
jgi:hypothetical protein